MLKEGDRYLELTLRVQNLLSEANKVNHSFVIEPVEENDKTGTIEKASQIAVVRQSLSQLHQLEGAF